MVTTMHNMVSCYMNIFQNWTTQVRKGLVEYAIMNSLRNKELYGYVLAKILLETPGLEVTEGTIYPLLSRLKIQGIVTTRLVESKEGPVRKYYQLTNEGQEMLLKMDIFLEEFLKGIQDCKSKGNQNDLE